MRALLLLGLWSLLIPGVRAEEGGDAAERQRLLVAHGEIEARYQRGMRECEHRFSVTNCQERARLERREALAPIEARLAAIDEAQRVRRAQERLDRIEAGKAERARRESDAASTPVAEPRLPRPAPAASGKLPRAPLAPTTAASAAERAAQEQRARERYQHKQDEAEAHRSDVERRNATGKPPAAPLPPASRP